MPELPVPERVMPSLRASSSCEESGDIVRVQARVDFDFGTQTVTSLAWQLQASPAALQLCTQVKQE